eukprot:gene9021-biopygen1652
MNRSSWEGSWCVDITSGDEDRISKSALELLAEMRGRGMEPDVITYSAAISACEKGKEPGKAIELLEEMREHGLEPDLISYSAAISAHYDDDDDDGDDELRQPYKMLDDVGLHPAPPHLRQQLQRLPRLLPLLTRRYGGVVSYDVGLHPAPPHLRQQLQRLPRLPPLLTCRYGGVVHIHVTVADDALLETPQGFGQAPRPPVSRDIR